MDNLKPWSRATLSAATFTMLLALAMTPSPVCAADSAATTPAVTPTAVPAVAPAAAPPVAPASATPPRGEAGAAAGKAVAVFNFQMKAGGADWLWLEKGLADRLITDFLSLKGLAVLDRDRMTEVAERMRWVPEMQGDSRRVPKLEFTAHYLVTGVYEVSADQLTVTAIVIDLATRKEVARREVAGPAANALDLQRQLGAELLAWLTKRPAERILAELPAWTRSLPAAKVLYEGVGLYDQGRYGEAWLLFRRAAATDPQYVDALYFVGKMYYFLDRYDHARLTYEKFFYQCGLHPRLGDAIKEYIDTYERLNPPAAELQQLYESFFQRYAPPTESYDPIKVRGEWGGESLMLSEWLVARLARLAEEQGNYRRAIELPYIDYVQVLNRFSRIVAQRCARADQMIRGALVPPNAKNHDRDPLGDVYPAARILLSRSGAEVTLASRPELTHVWLTAPDGFIFKSLTFTTTGSATSASPGGWSGPTGPAGAPGPSGPIVPSRPAGPSGPSATPPAAGQSQNDLLLILSKDGPADVLRWRKPVAEIGRTGLCLENLPRTGLLRCDVQSPVQVRVRAELEKLSSHGAILAVCENTGLFRVDVDGRMGRQGFGLVGLLTPGEHTLTFRPINAKAPFAELRIKAVVRAGEVTRVSAKLPWQAGSPWAEWQSALLAQEYPGYLNVLLYPGPGEATIMADDSALRALWSYGRDLWLAESGDGQSFTAPRQLALPVSTAWLEDGPRLYRHEDGRFALWFRSDRGILHNTEPYCCWSRDLTNWSAPALVDQAKAPLGWLKGAAGLDDLNLCAAAGDSPKRGQPIVAVRAPGSCGPWGKGSSLKVEPSKRGGQAFVSRLMRREDGGWEAFGQCWPSAQQTTPGTICCWQNDGGDQWSAPEVIYADPELIDNDRTPQVTLVGAVRADGLTRVLLEFALPTVSEIERRLVIYTRAAPGRWEACGEAVGLGPVRDFAWHPRWGYILLTMAPQGHEWYHQSGYGPIISYGPTLAPLTDGPPPAASPATWFQKVPPPIVMKAGAAKPSSAVATGPPPKDQAAFMAAIKAQDVAAVRAALAAHRPWANLPAGEKNELPLRVAIAGGYDEIVSALLDGGADANARWSVPRLIWKNDWVESREEVCALYEAISARRSAIAKLLLARRAKALATTSAGNTPLHAACAVGDLELVKMLMAAGATVNVLGDARRTPLLSALGPEDGLAEKLAVARFLVEKGADVKARTAAGLGTVACAVRFGDTDFVELLLAKKADINAVDAKNHSALTAALALSAAIEASPKQSDPQAKAALAEQAEKAKAMFDFLLRKGASIKTASPSGATPLHFAAERNLLDCAALLMAKGASPTAGDAENVTPLHLAARASPAMVNLLADAVVAAKGNIDCTTANGGTPLHIAATIGAGQVEAMLAHGAMIEARDKEGWTPLIKAVGWLNGFDREMDGLRLKVVEKLVAAGADVNARDNKGQSALAICIEQSQKDKTPMAQTIKFLRAHGAKE